MVLTLTDLLSTIVSYSLVPCSLFHETKNLTQLIQTIYIYLTAYHWMAGSLALEI